MNIDHQLQLLYDILLFILKTYVSYRLLRVSFAFLSAVVLYLLAPYFYQPNFDQYRNRWTGI